jgi:transcriptional regulator with XRE-family HTH domain
MTLARKVGVSQAFLAQMELGTRTGTIGVYLKLAPALGVRIKDLVEAS